jgi:hypothetical protein
MARVILMAVVLCAVSAVMVGCRASGSVGDASSSVTGAQ